MRREPHSSPQDGLALAAGNTRGASSNDKHLSQLVDCETWTALSYSDSHQLRVLLGTGALRRQLGLQLSDVGGLRLRQPSHQPALQLPDLGALAVHRRLQLLHLKMRHMDRFHGRIFVYVSVYVSDAPPACEALVVNFPVTYETASPALLHYIARLHPKIGCSSSDAPACCDAVVHSSEILLARQAPACSFDCISFSPLTVFLDAFVSQHTHLCVGVLGLGLLHG